MKKEIHPKYDKAVIKCACGNVIETKSSVPGEMHVELCSACHPFYTGKQKFIDTAGRVDKFKARMEAARLSKKTKGKIQKDDSDNTTKARDNSEKLKALKEDLVITEEPKTTEAPGEVTQAATSDEENAAADELPDSSKIDNKEN